MNALMTLAMAVGVWVPAAATATSETLAANSQDVLGHLLRQQRALRSTPISASTDSRNRLQFHKNFEWTLFNDHENKVLNNYWRAVPSIAHAISKRSPLELGLVHGISSSDHQVTHHGTNSHTSSHHNVVVHPSKSPHTGSSSAATSHHHVVQISPLHDVEGLVTHAVIDPGLHITSTTVFTHDKPLAAHQVVDATAVHPVDAHAVIAAAAHTIVTADHPIEHHEVAVIPVVVKHEVIAVDHPAVEKTAIVLHPHSVAQTHDIFRSHIGGYGVGVDFGGHGAGHGFYASTGFGFR